MNFRAWRQFNGSLIGLIAGIFIVLMSFQNCGKAGMDQGSSTSSLTADTPEVKKFKAAPIPFDVNINQVAFMTCPMAGKSTAVGEDVDSPFFTLRVGAFDNRSLAARYSAFGATATVDPDRTDRLNAGIGLSRDFLDYMETEFASRLSVSTADQKKLLYRNAIANSSYKYQLSSGLVYIARNSSSGFAIAQDDAKPILAPLSEANIASQLVQASELGSTYGTSKMQTLTGVEVNERSFVTSIGVPENETQRDQFRSSLINMEFVVGYTSPDTTGDVLMLASPTSDNAHTLYGKSYRFTTTNTWNGRVDRYVNNGTIAISTGIASINSEFISNVQEWQTLSKGASKNISASKNHHWDCFSLMIVREIDRRDTVTQKILDPGEYEDAVTARNCALWSPPAAECKTKMKFYDYQANATSAIVPSAKVACPIQRLGDSSSYGSLNYTADGGLNRMRLEIARRFLPAEYWEINTHPEYMCAVPRTTTKGLGQCYASGDFDGTKYILYAQQATELGAAVTCGINGLTGATQKECPAFVSICYRNN